uniref:Uncharacterized protein n=1 Tax=Arundo donax TaxID=35708 RepID=A0A0A8YNU7_ARUDO
MGATHLPLVRVVLITLCHAMHY